MRRYSLLLAVSLTASWGCTLEEGEGPDDLEQSGDESTDAGELEPIGLPDSPGVLVPVPDSTEASPCPGGCNNPPVCQMGPGQCVVDPFNGTASCWYPNAWVGTTCDSGNPCMVAECNGGGCGNTWAHPPGKVCDDGNPATVNDVCDGAGNCAGVAGCPGGCNNPPECHMGPGQCQIDPFSGTASCWYPHAWVGTTCDGGNPCMTAECYGGSCNNVWPNIGQSCNDGNSCTTQDQCTAMGTCKGTYVCGGPKGPIDEPFDGPIPL
ncbi:MAG: hypothetical protein K0V04_37220 [Deltaproteobacteria bacterium]|nr:hypothetical protein [Deltaproteobacteria bacterium]